MEKSIKKGSSGQKESTTVDVSGLPQEAMENSIRVHFQKIENGGGDIRLVEMLRDGKAKVTFENPQVAEKVVNTEQNFRGNVLKVKRLETEKINENAEKLRNEENSGEKKSTTVEVFGLPEESTENSVHIPFKKKKNGGGEVTKVEMLGEEKARITFEDPQVAGMVVNTEQIFKGNTLEVKRLGTEKMEKLRNKDSSEESTTVEVSGLPEGCSENNVHIHFQKRRNGGGEVKRVEMLGDGKARVTFEDPQVAKQVSTQTDQTIKGNVVHVKLVQTETQRTEAIDTPGNVFPAVLVSGLPGGCKENDVYIHFQRKKNGGGGIKEVKLESAENQATVIFEDVQVARRVVATQQEMKGKVLTVALQDEESSTEMKEESKPELKTPEVKQEKPAAPESKKTLESEKEIEKRRQITETSLDARASLETIDPVFHVVSATVNPMLLNTGSEYFWSDVFNAIQRSCGVSCQVSAYGTMLTGSLSQVAKAGEILQYHYRRSGTIAHQNNQTNPAGFQHNTTGPHQFGNQQNIYAQNFLRPPWLGQTNPHSHEPQKPLHSTGDAHQFENQQKNSHSVENQPLPGNTANSPNSTVNSKREQELQNNIDSSTRAENLALKVNMSQQDLATLPEGSLNSTTGEAQLPVNDQQNSNQDSSTGLEGHMSDKFVPPTNDKASSRSEKAPIPPKRTMNHPVSIENTTSNSLTKSESPSTSSDQNQSSSNDTTDSQSAKSQTSPQSAINDQLPGNQQDRTIPGAEIVKTSTNPHGSPRNKKPDSDSGKSPGQPEATINPQRQSNDAKQNILTEPRNSTESGKNGESPSNEMDNLSKLMGNLNIINNQPPNNDEEGSTTNPIIEATNLATSNEATVLENLNAELPSNVSLAGKPGVETTEQSKHSKEKTKKQMPPVAPPRKNKPVANEPRQNAANFSNAPGKLKQNQQENTSPNEPSKSVNYDVGTTKKTNHEGEQSSLQPQDPNNKSVKDDVALV